MWTAGDVVEVSWSLNANHGGGYYWRLCKLPEDGSPVTEDCFQETPLVFVGNTTLRWDGDNTTDEEIDNVFVGTGTHPPGSTWAMSEWKKKKRKRRKGGGGGGGEGRGAGEGRGGAKRAGEWMGGRTGGEVCFGLVD